MSKLFLALVVGAVCLCAQVSASVDETPYQPNAEIDRFHWRDFNATIDYAKDVGIYRIAPWIIVGVVLVVIFLIWSCCRCCHCGCCDHTYDMSKTTRNVLAVIAVGCGIGGAIILIYGFKADSVQRDAVNSLPELFQNVIDWKNKFLTASDNITANCDVLLSDINDISANDPSNTYISSSDITSMQNILNDIKQTAQDINSNINDVDFEKMKSDYADTAAKYDDYRHLAVIILFSVCLGFLLIQLIFALMNAYAVDECKPANCCCCLQPIITGLHLLLIFLAFIITAVLFGVATGLADFCIDADNNLITSVKLQSNEIAVYYMQCDENPNLQNPIFNDTNAVGRLFNDTRGNITEWRDDVAATTNCGSTPSCTNMVTLLDNTLSHVDDLEISVGKKNAQNQYTTGILRLVDCTEVNGKYQAVLNASCGTLFDSIRRTFIVMALFAFVMVLAEILYRFLGDAHRKLDKDFDGRDVPMRDVKGQAEMDPPPYKPTPSGWNRV